MSDILYLPVSIGEAMDKLSILEIKLELINDENRKNEVKKEYDLLYEKLHHVIINYSEFYRVLKHINKEIWFIMDLIRDKKNENMEEYNYLCNESIILNDARFRAKNKINTISNSSLKEQKGYNVLRCLFDLKYNSIDLCKIIKLIKYYSYFYDEIIVINYTEKDISFLKNEFKYDNSIIFKNDFDLSICKKIINI